MTRLTDGGNGKIIKKGDDNESKTNFDIGSTQKMFSVCLGGAKEDVIFKMNWFNSDSETKRRVPWKG